MGFYTTHILPRITDVALSGAEFSRMRERATAGLEGDVVELGFGSGRNVPHYPDAVDRVYAIEPSGAARRMAERRLASSSAHVEHVGLDGEHLPLADTSVDHALTTWTLCTIPDVARALGETRRVLRPGGTLHFVEHGRAPDPRVARWQDRLTPLQRRLFGGCHLNRPIDRLLLDAGFELTRLDAHYVRGPRPFSYMFEGVATRRG
jgi:ubiquinone/menaquinone biosynthesis C-methylase UbiE